MIFKGYRNLHGEKGWLYVDGVRTVHVDRSTWCIAAPTDKESPEAYRICRIVPVSVGGPMTDAGAGPAWKPDLAMPLVMADEVWFDGVEAVREQDAVRVVVITVETLRGETLRYVQMEDGPNAWLLSDEGKTVERLP